MLVPLSPRRVGMTGPMIMVMAEGIFVRVGMLVAVDGAMTVGVVVVAAVAGVMFVFMAHAAPLEGVLG